MDSNDLSRMDRRDAIKWMLAATATVSLMNTASFGAEAVASPIGTDPNMIKPIVPWPRTFNAEQLKTARALCDLIIPADDRSPSAGKVGVADFIDEWVSAPYIVHQTDRKHILDGFAWLDGEATTRFQKKFSELTAVEQTEICDPVALLSKAKPEHKEAATFFAKYRNLTAGGFYTTREGMKDVQYIGNVPTTSFAGPPKEVLVKLGLA